MRSLFKHILDNIVYLTAFSFFISKSPISSKLFTKEKFNRKENFVLIFIFSLAAITGTYVGIDYLGAIANTRNIGVVIGGLIGGPSVGFFIGLIAGLHRFLIDVNGITSLPCSLATLLGGTLAGHCIKLIGKYNRKTIAFTLGVIVENISMLFILILSRPYALALEIVTNIYIPMVLLNALGILIIIILMEDITLNQEKEAGKQIKLAMDIATETLPYFRNSSKESLLKVCEIIQQKLNAQLVVITDTKKILVSASQDERFEAKHQEIKSDYTKRVINTGKIIDSSYSSDSKDLVYNNKNIKSAIIAPLKINTAVKGTLKIYFDRKNFMGARNKYLIEGLSDLISNQMEISQIAILKEMANKSEIKALQAQINPHFLFNTLNAISSFIRFDPNKARELIQDFATYLRSNIDSNDEEITLSEELKRCKSYSNIELARFSDTLEIIYNIEEDCLKFKILALSIQPLVENAIQHGALKAKEKGLVEVKIKKVKNKISITVIDNGAGISNDKIKDLFKEEKINNRIGLYNVHKRLLLYYGKGLKIDNKNGTKISFDINISSQK